MRKWQSFFIGILIGLQLIPGVSSVCAETIINSGHDGDFYHNADDLHTNLSNPTVDHPGLTLMTPTRGAVTTVQPGRVVGNASLAYHHVWTGGSNLVSIMRYKITYSQYEANLIYNQYRANNAYWYPEHRDHDARDNHHTMTPTATNSQGSSGSEMDEVKKFLWTLAAFQTDTKEVLSENGILMPTVQMIMRRTRVTSDLEYLSDKAHKNAYENFSNADAMKQMAAAMPADSVPPMVQLEVINDTFTGTSGREIFQASPTQRLYNTPVSISRLWRNLNYTNKIIVSAENSFDVNGKPLTFYWAVIRGDSDHVRITPQNASSSIVEIEIDYHGETEFEGGTKKSNLVSIGAFVNNGSYYSAPAFVTSYTMPSEVRTYDETSKRLLEIEYLERSAQELLPNINGYPQIWDKDAFHYDEDGKLTGWTRTDDSNEYEFTPEGFQIISTKVDGSPDQVQNIYYSVDHSASVPRSKWNLSGAAFSYQADDEAPSTPLNLNASSITQNSFMLSWNASSDNISLAGYRIDVSRNSSFTQILDTYNNLDVNQLTTKIILGLTPLTTYYIRVRSYDHGGKLSSNSSVLIVNTTDGADEDDDNDGVNNGADCSPYNSSLWRNKAYSDPDGDGVRTNAVLLTVACFGSSAPSGFTISENGPDNCPAISNPGQEDYDSNGRGDVCDEKITGVWNGYLNQMNALECSSSHNGPMTMTLKVRNTEGLIIGERFIELPAFGSSHSILNDYDIFDRYGTYSVSLGGDEAGLKLVTCRTLFYRVAPDSDSRQLQYAYATPAGVPLLGVSSGLYNSMNPEGSLGLPVLNWLSVFNQSSSAFSALVEVYKQDGSLDTAKSFRIENLDAGNRIDSALGHPDGQSTGMYRIIPDKPEQPYGAFITRYGRGGTDSFNFAFNLLAKRGVNDSGPIAASSMGPAINWGEIANISDSEAIVEIEVYSREKERLHHEQRIIPPRAQHHIYLNAHIGGFSVGYFRVRVLSGGSGLGSLLVQSLYYGSSASRPGRIDWSYASQASGSLELDSSNLAIPINTFYESANWLKLFNAGDVTAHVNVSVHDMQGNELSSPFDDITLVGGADLPIHEVVGPNFAGTVRIQSESSVETELLRVFPMKVDGGSETNYITNILP